MPSDITDKVSSMPRNSAVLYKRTATGAKPDPPAYSGVLRLADGQTFWINAWARIVKGQPVIKIKLTPKTS